MGVGEEPERLRAQRIRYLCEQWMSVPNLPDNAIPASPDDVLWLLAEVERLAGERDEWKRRFKNERRLNVEVRAKLERLAGERDTLRDDRARADAAAGTNHTRAVKAEMECERLAGRVAALEALANALVNGSHKSDEDYEFLPADPADALRAALAEEPQ